MLLIHVPKLTNRLGYTLGVLFKHILHTEFSITTDADYFRQQQVPRLSYGPERVAEGVLHLKSTPLLFRTSIQEQEPRPFCRYGRWRLFPVYGHDADLDFDPLAATFFLVTRYEEYLPHREDQHGRYLTAESLAVEHGFADQPVVNQWALMLRDEILRRYPEADIPHPTYEFVQTVDIDSAWCYLHHGVARTLIGATRDLAVRHQPAMLRQRARVLLGRETDPYDTFDFILSLHPHTADAHLIFFVLVADYGLYDKAISYLNPHFQQLLQHLGDLAHIGLHPGYGTLENPRLSDIEKARLEAVIHRTIVRARLHFLRMRLPLSYRTLLHAGLRHDYTMGFADLPGFRAGIASPFPFFDLDRDIETPLLVHPFCAMDTTLRLQLGLTPDQAVDRYSQLIRSVRDVGGTYSCIVHNQNLSDVDGWHGWREAYQSMIALARP